MKKQVLRQFTGIALVALFAGATVSAEDVDRGASAAGARKASALAVSSPVAEPEFVRPSANIALGASYTMEPAPNYVHCTDPGDIRQLTDGQYSEGYFWVQPTTVGWHSAKPVVVTLDLGADKPIRGVSFRTAAGAAGVDWPLAISVFMSGEDRRFYEACELVGASAVRGLPPAQGYATHRYWTDQLRTHGRYVTFVFAAAPYAFVDELEVYEGDSEWLALPRTGTGVADVKALTQSVAIREAVARRLRKDIADIRAKTDYAEVSRKVRRSVASELDAIEKEMDSIPAPAVEAFRAVLPLNRLHERLFQAQASLWQAQGLAPLVVWQSGVWDALSHLADPPQEGSPAVRVRMMANEYRAGAFNLTNATLQPLTVEVRISGMPGGLNPDYIRVHEVLWTDTKQGRPVAKALPEVSRDGDAYRVSIPAGMTRQVWLTFHPRDIAPGVHEGIIEVKAPGKPYDVPLRLHVYPLRFPDQPTLHFGGWDYTNADAMYGVTPQNREALIAHLREHFADSPWGTSAAMPLGEYDAQGNMIKPPDTANFDLWLTRWPRARQYCVFANVPRDMGPAQLGTPGFDKAVQTWVSFWADYARAKGLTAEQICVLLVDEPRAAEQDEVILAWAKAIRAADTGIRVWEDPIYEDMTEANPAMVSACHVLCPNRAIFLRANQAYRDFFTAQRDRGSALEFYSCSGPARLLDPYAYYRMQAWTCWQYGATGSYFWAFGDGGGAPSWNGYILPGSDYTPLFLDETSVTAAKELEACREGIEDYEYLRMLRDAIATAATRGVRAEVLEQARKVLAEVPERVCKAGASETFRWSDAIDRTLADQARVEILDTLAALETAK